MTFHPVKGFNTYCGPVAIATLLGITTDEAAKRVRKINSRKMKVRGVAPSDLHKILKEAGWRLIKFPPYAKSTKVLIKERHHYPDGFYLLNETGHYRVLKRNGFDGGTGWLFVDSGHKTPTIFSALHCGKRIKNLHYLIPPEVRVEKAEEGPPELKELLRI